MVNVQIHQFQPCGAVVDAAALAQFQQQWSTYRKLVDSDCLAHREVGAMLRQTLNDVFTSPFCFLDIACGDASMMKTALRGTQVRHYHGIDLSQAALELAAANLAELPFAVDLDHRDFVDAMMRRPEHADTAWCSLSIHHLSADDKLHLMKAIRGATGARGIFLFYEPTRSRPFRADEQAGVDSIDAARMGPDLAPHLDLRLSRDRSRLVRARPRGRLCEGGASLRRSDRLLPALPLRGVTAQSASVRVAGGGHMVGLALRPPSASSP